MIIDPHPDFSDKSVFLEKSNSDGILIKRKRFFCYTTTLDPLLDETKCEWNTCSILIAATPEEFLWFNEGGKEPDFKIHQDPECEVALLALYDFMEYADTQKSCIAWDLICLIKQIKTLDYLEDTQFISFVLEDVSQKAHPDDHSRIFSLFRKVSNVAQKF